MPLDQGLACHYRSTILLMFQILLKRYQKDQVQALLIYQIEVLYVQLCLYKPFEIKPFTSCPNLCSLLSRTCKRKTESKEKISKYVHESTLTIFQALG